MKDQVVTRFAPSPTGMMHVGSLRTALYSYLWARHNKGKFILRIEDTDQERLVPGAQDQIIATLAWAGLDYDEGPLINSDDKADRGENGPYIQSERLDIYKKYIQELLDKNKVYRCFCSKEDLGKMR
ncbi:glutamate--tRNA ligase family protein, partial [Patescibacteria group bacterium]